MATHLIFTILRQAHRMSEWRTKRIVTAPRIDSRRHREIHDALGSAAFEQLLVTLRAAETAETTRLRQVLAATAGSVGFIRLAVMARLATPADVPILRGEIGRLQVDRGHSKSEIPPPHIWRNRQIDCSAVRSDRTI